MEKFALKVIRLLLTSAHLCLQIDKQIPHF